MDSRENYWDKVDVYEQSKAVENEEALIYVDWCGAVLQYEFSILVDGPEYHIPFTESYASWFQKKKYENKIRSIKPIQKELPDDVLAIIRAYSKPTFVWYKEYNEARCLSLCVHQMKKLKEKIGDPNIREQLKICVDAYADHKQMHEFCLHVRTPVSEERESKSDWWKCVSLDRLSALLCDCKYYAMNYAEWYFKDDIDDAWMDDTWSTEWEREQALWNEQALEEQSWMNDREQEAWMNDLYPY
jgi:hypothetical protein